MNWIIGQNIVGNKNGVQYRVISVTEELLTLRDINTHEDVIIPIDLADNLDITTVKSKSFSCLNNRDFVSIVEVERYMQVDSALWAKFCFSNSIMGVAPVSEKYIPETLWVMMPSYRFLFDHSLLCLSSDGTVVLVCNPYLTNKEISVMCSRLDLDCHVVLGKDVSFYAPGKSNLVVFDLENFK